MKWCSTQVSLCGPELSPFFSPGSSPFLLAFDWCLLYANAKCKLILLGKPISYFFHVTQFIFSLNMYLFVLPEKDNENAMFCVWPNTSNESPYRRECITRGLKGLDSQTGQLDSIRWKLSMYRPCHISRSRFLTNVCWMKGLGNLKCSTVLKAVVYSEWYCKTQLIYQSFYYLV